MKGKNDEETQPDSGIDPSSVVVGKCDLGGSGEEQHGALVVFQALPEVVGI